MSVLTDKYKQQVTTTLSVLLYLQAKISSHPLYIYISLSSYAYLFMCIAIVLSCLVFSTALAEVKLTFLLGLIYVRNFISTAFTSF